MNTNIQLIQLTVRFEREEKAQRRSFVTHSDALINELSGYLHKLNDHIKQHIFNPPRRQQCCQCA